VTVIVHAVSGGVVSAACVKAAAATFVKVSHTDIAPLASFPNNSTSYEQINEHCRLFLSIWSDAYSNTRRVLFYKVKWQH